MPSAHLETIYAACGGCSAVAYRRRIVRSPDGDEIVLDGVWGLADKPLLVIFHGLEGSSQSSSVRRIAAFFAALGWNVAVPHFRTCGGKMNILPRAYHAADDGEVDWMLGYCARAFSHCGLFAVGISLGGNALINWAAKRESESAGGSVCACATISVPFDLASSVRAMGRGINRRLYAEHFLKTLRAKVLQKQKQYPKWFAANARLQNDIAKARTLADFDEWYTAPAHDFASAADYWQSGSCADSLQRVKLPLLCINAMNDPIVPPSSLPNPKTTPPNIRIRRPQTGAHAAFTGTPKNWLPMQLSDFFARHTREK